MHRPYMLKKGYAEVAAFKFLITPLARPAKIGLMFRIGRICRVGVKLPLVCLGTVICASFAHAAINKVHKTDGVA